MNALAYQVMQSIPFINRGMWHTMVVQLCAVTCTIYPCQLMQLSGLSNYIEKCSYLPCLAMHTSMAQTVNVIITQKITIQILIAVDSLRSSTKINCVLSSASVVALWVRIKFLHELWVFVSVMSTFCVTVRNCLKTLPFVSFRFPYVELSKAYFHQSSLLLT
jgi:hypothetical protein